MSYESLFTGDTPPVILVSAELPGCGSSTLCSGIEDRAKQLSGQDVYKISVGQLIREQLGVETEAELQEKLQDVSDPREFDPLIYGSLPKDKVVIVDGKLATTYGPVHIDADRPILSIDLITPPIISAKRILQREGSQTLGDIDFPERLISTLSAVLKRHKHDLAMREGVTPEVSRVQYAQIELDTSRYAQQELVEKVFNGIDHDFEKAEEWEIEALRQAFLKLTELRYRGRQEMRLEDRVHFDHQMEAISYGIDRLQTTINALGIAAIRGDLKTAIIDCWYGLMMKKIPRFNGINNEEGDEIKQDTDSMAWSPEFYKIAEGWPTIKSYLNGKTVLDPYAGSGEMMNLLVARGVVSTAIFSDILYTYGKDGLRYDPVLNTQAGLLLFDDLPSWYKPDLTPIAGYVAADSRKLPIIDNAVDFVFGDPPYGKNHLGPGIGTLLGSIEELRRVSREGVIVLVPEHWVEDISATGLNVELLTKDLSRGQSGYPVCYIYISSTS